MKPQLIGTGGDREPLMPSVCVGVTQKGSIKQNGTDGWQASRCRGNIDSGKYMIHPMNISESVANRDTAVWGAFSTW